MRNLKALSVLALLLMVGSALAWHPPGWKELKYYSDADVPQARFGYAGNGHGYGVVFNPFSADCNEQWVELCTVYVNLCPPRNYGDYREQIVILPVKSNGQPDLLANALWTSPEFDVQVGQAWHVIPITKSGGLWVKAPAKVCVLAKTTSGYGNLFQWFDHTRNAPVNTQWYYNATTGWSVINTFSNGDAMIRLIVQRHDFRIDNIDISPADCHTRVNVLNLTGFEEFNVPIHVWIKDLTTNRIVYDKTQLYHAPEEERPVSRWFDFPVFTGVRCHRYTIYARPEFHAPGKSYPIGEWWQYNDQFSKNFTR